MWPCCLREDDKGTCNILNLMPYITPRLATTHFTPLPFNTMGDYAGSVWSWSYRDLVKMSLLMLLCFF